MSKDAAPTLENQPGRAPSRFMSVRLRLSDWFDPSGTSWHRFLVPVSICALWACTVLPNLTVRSFIWEEGANAEIARDVFARGDFLHPLIYGISWIEKPSLLGWIIAGVASITGEVNEWSARLPAMISVLLTALLVQSLTRRYASLAASLFAGLAFLYSPMLLQKLTIAEPDTVITLLSFAAFVLWWNGAATDSVSFARWIGCGLLLAVLSMAKGPQPVGFFALGVGAYLLANRRWQDIPGLVVCLVLPAAATVAWALAVYEPGREHVWLAYMRLQKPDWSIYLKNLRTLYQLPAELLPALLLLPYLWWPRAARSTKPVVAPLSFYAFTCTAILLIWPGANSRYAMPIVPAIAVLAGIAWDRMAENKFSRWRAVLNGTIAVLVGYQLLLVTVVMPLFAERFGNNRRIGELIERALRADPVPAFCKSEVTTQPDTNQLFYMRAPIRCLSDEQLDTLGPPAWLVAPPNVMAAFVRRRPGLNIKPVVETSALVAARLQ